MADDDYRRLAAACPCGAPAMARVAARGRPPKYCGPCKEQGKTVPGLNAAGWQWQAQHALRCQRAECGRLFMGKLASAKYCSPVCRNKVCNREAQERRRDRSMRRCKYCAAEFTPAYGDLRSVFCANACKAKAQNASRGGSTHRRRAKQYGVAYDASVDRLAVFERDGWRCQMCGHATPRALSGTKDARAPTLDHLVAFKLGGSHTWDNVVCMCRRCNAIKRDLPLDVAIERVMGVGGF